MRPLRAATVWLLFGAGVGPGFRVAGQEPVPPIPAPLTLARAAGPVRLDGRLDDPAWDGATRVETFYETVFGDDREPAVGTLALVMYDDRALYVGLRCDDPRPELIRAPYVERDAVIGTDDNVAVFLDTRNDRRSAQEFRVSPRGIQADAVYNDANGNEDFSPDFFYDSAARVTPQGWEAELRIPLSSLRYGGGDPQSWGLIVWRNYPRDRRYAIYSSPQPRGANCIICRSRELTGITGLPAAGHLVAAPYASGQGVSRAPEPGQPLGPTEKDADLGLDVKWTPTAGTALDATLNPDFSQIESDVAQVTANTRFALFYPEKRPFFLEGVDLFDTPVQAVYTRTVTSPRWGARATGKLGASSYTALVAQDRGGGSVVLPGPDGSSLAPQDYGSLVGLARWRRDLGGSFLGLLYAGREVEDGGGHNRVFGPDGQWRPSRVDTLTGQLLYSDTLDPRSDQPDASGHALHLEWQHSAEGVFWSLRYRDFGEGFRDDQGFVPQVGYRAGRASLALPRYPQGFWSFLRPSVLADAKWERDGRLLEQTLAAELMGFGRRNLQAYVDLVGTRTRVGETLLDARAATFGLQVDPGRRFPRVGLDATVGQRVDYAGARVGDGADLRLWATLRPHDRLTLELNSALSWLDLPEGRLFTAQVQRAKLQLHLSARCFVRLVGQYVETENDPALYPSPAPEREAGFSGSALLSYRLDWQTALYVGYGDERALDPRGSLQAAERQLFVKLSYAWQR